MTDITLHLTANFYPPIPHDIQMACQNFFDSIVEDAMPWMIVDKDGHIIDQDIEDYDVLDRTLILPNGAEITAGGMLDELRLWDALWWDCDPEILDDDPELQYAESKEISGQLPFWTEE